MRNRIAFVLAGAFFTLASGAALAASHPAMGTWNLNLAKSTDESGQPAPKSETFVFAESDKGISLTSTIVAADGKQTVNNGTPIKWDGKAWPDKTNPDHDSVTVSQVGARTIAWSFHLKGKLIRSGTLTVSTDGKMMTVSGASVGAKGTKTYFNDVFDRK
jgi:hypothetical protein